MRQFLFFWMLMMIRVAAVQAQTYENLKQEIIAGQPQEKITQRAQVEMAWKTGKLLDDYLLERNAQATETVNRLAIDLKDDPSRLYYDLQFARAYPEAPPSLDLPWGFYQYFLAINDPRERNGLAEQASQGKWTWDKMREEVKKAGRDNKEFVFTETPGESGVYRIIKAKRGPYRSQLVLDLGFGVYWKPANLSGGEYEIVQAQCAAPESCVFKPMPGGEKNLFTFAADVIRVMDGDTFQAVLDLGFGLTALQTFRLWGLDAPEINTKEGRAAKKALESLITDKRIVIRTLHMEKYGRYLADVWALADEKSPPLYVNSYLTDQGLAEKQSRQMR